MKLNQSFTPKYWIFHNRLTDDVYIRTAHKSFDDCRLLAGVLCKDEYKDFVNNEFTCYGISLFELNLLQIVN